MKKTLHRILLLAALLTAAACTREMKTATAADSGKVALEGYDDTACGWSYSMEYVTGGLSREVMDEINRTIIRNAISYDENDMSTDISAACLDWVADIEREYNDFSAEVLAELDEEDEPWMLNWSYSLDGSFSTGCASRSLKTYETMDDSYTGGAHGSTYHNHMVFNLLTGKVITEADLFMEGFEDALSETLYDRILEDLDEELWDAIYETPTFNGNFTVSEQGVTWWYNPYEIGPYVLGFLSAAFTWDELAPYLRQ